MKVCNGRLLLGSSLVSLMTAVLTLPVFSESPATLEVGKFSTAAEGSALPEGWKPLIFKKVPRNTAYSLVRDSGTVVVKAVSAATASGLAREVAIDPREYPVVCWRWKIENLLKTGDVTRKDGDDYPARLYVTFAYDPDKISFSRRVKYKAGRMIFGDIPIAAINYIWDATAPQGLFIDNAFTDFAKMIVIRSGQAGVGTWVAEERNVYEDYQKAFGGEPPMINGVAIMTDTDNTKESAVAYYGDIMFKKGAR
jgi:Protein of unknown function (DUF3047)